MDLSSDVFVGAVREATHTITDILKSGAKPTVPRHKLDSMYTMVVQENHSSNQRPRLLVLGWV